MGKPDRDPAELWAALRTPAAWTESALCAQTDAELWFPEKGVNAVAAKRICRDCPVNRECLALAVAQPLPVSGIWGGTTEKDRRALRAQSKEIA